MGQWLARRVEQNRQVRVGVRVRIRARIRYLVQNNIAHVL